MASIVQFTPSAAHFPSTNYPQLVVSNIHLVLAYDPTTNETAYFTFVAPAGITGTLTLKIYYKMATATSGDVDIDVAVQAVSDGDALDLDSATSFDTVNSVDNTNVPATAGAIDVISVTLTNNDGLVAGDFVTLSITRDAASDTAAGDLHILLLELQDGN